MTKDQNLNESHFESEQQGSEQYRIRAEKRVRLIEEGLDPYPVEVPVTATIEYVRKKYGHLTVGEETQDTVGVMGRVVFSRNTGKLCFASLQDGHGNTLQVMLSEREIGRDSLTSYKTYVDLGDILFAHGRIISSKRGELSVLASSSTVEDTESEVSGSVVPAWMVTAKALRPLPKVFETEEGEMVGLSEDNRVRRRYLDLIMRPDAREMVHKRAAMIRSMRDFLHERSFIEIETPMLQTIPGGAAARPFVTHINAYDTDLYLRIAPELYLKRALVGGIEKVFELNRNFRNEGADSSHNPEFSMLEVYEALGTYDTMADLTRQLIQRAARDTFGNEKVTLRDGTKYDLSGEWKQITLFGSISDALGQEINVNTSREQLVKYAETLGQEIPDHYNKGKVAEVLFEELVAGELYEPTFVRDFPAESSPLTRQHRSEPGLTEKWDLYVRGFELATAYSELTDPVIQRERFEQQSFDRAKGDHEAMELDSDFLEAMDHGMPPAGGMGLGVDRLLMALTGEGIRDTILFPLVKRQ